MRFVLKGHPATSLDLGTWANLIYPEQLEAYKKKQAEYYAGLTTDTTFTMRGKIASDPCFEAHHRYLGREIMEHVASQHGGPASTASWSSAWFRYQMRTSTGAKGLTKKEQKQAVKKAHKSLPAAKGKGRPVEEHESFMGNHLFAHGGAMSEFVAMTYDLNSESLPPNIGAAPVLVFDPETTNPMARETLDGVDIDRFTQIVNTLFANPGEAPYLTEVEATSKAA